MVLDPQPDALAPADSQQVRRRQRLTDPPQRFDDLHLNGMKEARDQRPPVEVLDPPPLVALCHRSDKVRRIGRSDYFDLCQWKRLPARAEAANGCEPDPAPAGPRPGSHSWNAGQPDFRIDAIGSTSVAASFISPPPFLC